MALRFGVAKPTSEGDNDKKDEKDDVVFPAMLCQPQSRDGKDSPEFLGLENLPDCFESDRIDEYIDTDSKLG